VESLRPQLAPKIALCFFVLGVILVGAYNALFFHHADNLTIRWHSDVGRFYGGKIGWDTLENDDRERSSRGIVWLYVVGYLSFGCFIAGAAVGLLWARF